MLCIIPRFPDIKNNMQHGWQLPSITYKEPAVALGTCEFTHNRAEQLYHGCDSTTQKV